MKTTPLSTMFEGTNIDEATQQNIYNWFQFRYLCDNSRFLAYFQRQVLLYQMQYLSYLRVETTEIDPMVADYMERQILRDGSTVAKTTGTDTTTGSNNSTDSTEYSGSDVTAFETERNGNSEGTTNGTTTTTNSGSDVTTVEYGKTSNTNNESTTANEATSSDSSDNQGMTGQTPDSSVYPASGFPENLQWQYASTQAQNKVTGEHSENSESTVNGSTTVTEGGSDDTTLTHGLKSEVVTTGNTTGTDSVSGTDTTTVQHGQKVANTVTGDSSSSVEHNTSVDTTVNDDTRERYSGRHESPQDLLDRARSYILNTNAFKWFIEKLDPCFLAFYEV